jgi:hypothetical protein
MAHLISLGGWLRGLEISAAAVAANFSPERAEVLADRELADYFTEELKTLPPRLIHAPLFEAIRSAVKTIGSILNRQPPAPLTIADVRELQNQAHAANQAIRQIK